MWSTNEALKSVESLPEICLHGEEWHLSSQGTAEIMVLGRVQAVV